VLGPNDIVLCSGTLLEASFREKVEAASATGCQAISLWPEDIQNAQSEGLSDADVRALLSDAGLAIAELDPLLSWLMSGSLGDGAAAGADDKLGRGEEVFFDLAERFGGTLINCAHPFPGDVDLDQAAESFAGLCDRAAERGLACAIEFLPWTGIPDVSTAAEVARRAGKSNGGVLFDTWHHLRGTNDNAALAATAGELIKGVQLNNAPATPNGNPMVESMHERLLPNQGALDVAELVAILDRIGSQAPIGIEVFSDELNALAPNEAAQRCVEATREVLKPPDPSARRSRGAREPLRRSSPPAPQFVCAKADAWSRDGSGARGPPPTRQAEPHEHCPPTRRVRSRALRANATRARAASRRPRPRRRASRRRLPRRPFR